MNIDVHLHGCLLHPQLNHDLCHRVERGKETSVGLASRTTTCDVSTHWLKIRVSLDHGGDSGTQRSERESRRAGEPESSLLRCQRVSASVRRQSAGHLVHRQTRRSASPSPGPRPRTSWR